MIKERLTLDYNNMMKDFVGNYGISEEEIDSLMDKCNKGANTLKVKKESGMLGFKEIPYNQGEIVNDIKDYVNQVKDEIDTFVVLGIGGSALGPIAMQQALNHPYYNELSKEKRNGFPKLYVLDNVDPEKLTSFFDIVDLDKTLFNVISKSGSTSETMSQYMIIEDMLSKEYGEESLSKHIVFTTDSETGNLVKVGRTKNFKMFYVPQNVGGRFSELCPVGLLAAAMCGIDIEALLEGARYMDEICSSDDIKSNPAFMFALLQYICMNKGMRISVMMPYADSLKYMSDWYAQLWAESIGKKVDNDGNEVFVGMTPVKALGVTDQHSQVQLYTEGPFDKLIIFLGTEKYNKELMIPNIYEDIPSIGFLGGHSQNELIKIEQASTEYALTKAGKPNMTLTFPEVNAFTVGSFIQMMEVATAFMGELMNINAFNQPGVEEGKNATYAMFNKPGYAEKREELNAAKEKEEKYRI